MASENRGYKTKLLYVNMVNSSIAYGRRKNKVRKIWFTPPYNFAIAIKIGREIFRILKKNFPPSNVLHKIFNKNTVKLSCSCMLNMANWINKYYTKKTKK